MVMAKQIYPWKRFWCSYGGSLSLSDGGYLSDPDSEWGHVYTQDIVSFEAIATVPCLVLLGEPGIGKSHAIAAEKEKLDLKIKQEGDKTFEFNLRAYGSEDRLTRNLFESEDFATWKRESHRLYVFLDSLDEGLLRINVLAPLLVEEFGKIEKQTLQRLSLRLACRTADWPQSLATGLRELWGEDAVRAFELAPLRRKDVIEAAKANNLNAEEFLAEIDRIEAVPLAIKPVTLDFLLGQYRKNQHLPKTRGELYREGCLLLCEENNQNRRDTQLKGDFSAEQRLIVAARIAAVTVFANRYAVWTDVDRGDVPDEDVAIRELVGGKEKANGNEFEVSEQAIKETLGTGLFSARGSNRLGWAHQTYAEFLAAYYLVHSGMSLSQMMSLIVHPDDQEGKLVPQLHETAAWLASMVHEVFRELTEKEPEVLLRSDVATTGEGERAALVKALLKLCDEERSLIHHDWGIYRYYHKLLHPQLAEQLLPYLRDRAKTLVARQLAIDIAKACKLQALQDDLAAIALDPSQPLRVRVDAAAAVARIGDEKTKGRLQPLVTGETGDDPEDDLKGYGLQALWPIHLNARELFALITSPKSRVIGGTYQSFLWHDIVPHLQVADLIMALEWIETQEFSLKISHPLGNLVTAIMIRAWEQIDSPGVLEAFARIALKRLKNHETIVGDRSRSQPKDFFSDNDEKRKRLLAALLTMIAETEEDSTILLYPHDSLVLPTDIPWMIKHLKTSTAEKIQQAWAQLIERIFNRSDARQVDTILTTCREVSVLAEKFMWLLKPVELDSPEAQKMKAQYLEMQRWQDRSQKRHLLNPSPVQRISTLLNACEGSNLDAWWQLNMEMTLEPHDTDYGDDLEPDLKALPGWKASDSVTRRRIIEAAQSYVLRGEPSTHTWFGTNTFHRPAVAGYRALLLLLQEDPSFVSQLPVEVWKKWTPVILSYPLSSRLEGKEAHQDVMKRAYQFAPDEMVEHLMILIDKENRERDSLFILQRVKCCLDDSLAKVLLVKLGDEGLKPKVLEQLLTTLLEHGVSEAREFAVELISRLSLPQQENRTKAILAACALLTHTAGAGWSIVWPALQQNLEFAQEVIAAVGSSHHLDRKNIGSCLTEEQSADFYLWLVRQYPHDEDPQSEEGDRVKPTEITARFRDSLLQHLKGRGTLQACEAIRRIARELPKLTWLKWILLEAQHIYRQRTWAPPKPKDILEIAKNQRGRLVQSGEQLLEVLRESLHRLEQRLQGETPQVEFLWDQLEKNIWKPKDENSFSNYVKDHLDSDLKQKGVLVNREVEIRRSTGNQPGERVDIQVDAVSKKSNGEEYDRISVVIEVKGCWHDELNQAMQTQLVDRYLNEVRCQHGLYLVGWFDCPQWSDDDSRKRKAPRLDIETARTRFANQAKELSQAGIRVNAVVMNTALR